MLIVIISLILIICIPIALLIEKKYGEYTEKSIMFWVIGAFGAIASVIMIPICLIINSDKITELHKKHYELGYISLTQRIENWKNGDVSDANLWSDVYEYNNNLIDARYFYQNKWTSWFNNDACMEFKTIDIPTYINLEGK